MKSDISNQVEDSTCGETDVFSRCNGCAHMLIKLAMFDDMSYESDIIKCCKENDAQYLKIKDNLFGIGTDNLDMYYKNDDSSHEYEFNVATFVKVYDCALKTITKRKLFSRKNIEIYNGKILDNLFFKHIITYCKDNKKDILFARVFADGIELNYNKFDDIMDFFNDKRAFFKKIAICVDEETIIFNKRGYIDYSGDVDTFHRIENEFYNILNIGFGN